VGFYFRGNPFQCRARRIQHSRWSLFNKPCTKGAEYQPVRWIEKSGLSFGMCNSLAGRV